MRTHTAHKFTISWEWPMYFILFFQASQVNLLCCESKIKSCWYYRVSWSFFSKSKNVACFRLNILSPLIMFWSYEIMLCPCKACEGFLLFRGHDDSICKLSTGLIKIFVPFLHCLICKSMPGQFTACFCSFNLRTWSANCEWFFPCVAFSFTWQLWPWVFF